MNTKKNILAIIGSAGKNTANLALVKKIAQITQDDLNLTIVESLAVLPHFDPELSVSNTPEIITAFRQSIQQADGIIISTPEYIFSIPSGLKNAIEWCVSTTVFSKKPVGLITASASGEKAHEELQLIMRTVETIFNDDTTLLIKGIRGRIDENGNIKDEATHIALLAFADAFIKLVNDTNACIDK
jgi:chromate reductase